MSHLGIPFNTAAAIPGEKGSFGSTGGLSKVTVDPEQEFDPEQEVDPEQDNQQLQGFATTQDRILAEKWNSIFKQDEERSIRYIEMCERAATLSVRIDQDLRLGLSRAYFHERQVMLNRTLDEKIQLTCGAGDFAGVKKHIMELWANFAEFANLEEKATERWSKKLKLVRCIVIAHTTRRNEVDDLNARVLAADDTERDVAEEVRRRRNSWKTYLASEGGTVEAISALAGVD